MSSPPPPSSQQHHSKPYPPLTWGLGGKPESNIDVPIMSIFLVLYLCGFLFNSLTFKRNYKRGHLFLFSMLLSSFCTARIITLALRLASTYHPTNIPLLLATQVFIQAGVIPIYIVNLFFAQRIIRATHPHLGWSVPFNTFFFTGLFVILGTLCAVIVALVQTFFTRDAHTLQVDRDIMLFGVTSFVVVAVVPILLTVGALLAPRHAAYESFGTGSVAIKAAVLCAGSGLIVIGAVYRAATTWMDPVSLREPMPDYFCRAAFYLVNFTVEILVILLYAVVRVDKMFHAPEGSLKLRGYDNARQASSGVGLNRKTADYNVQEA